MRKKYTNVAIPEELALAVDNFYKKNKLATEAEQSLLLKL